MLFSYRHDTLDIEVWYTISDFWEDGRALTFSFPDLNELRIVVMGWYEFQFFVLLWDFVEHEDADVVFRETHDFP